MYQWENHFFDPLWSLVPSIQNIELERKRKQLHQDVGRWRWFESKLVSDKFRLEKKWFRRRYEGREKDWKARACVLCSQPACTMVRCDHSVPPRQGQCSWPLVACQPSWGGSELQVQRLTLSQETRVDSDRGHSSPPVPSARAYTQTHQVSSFLAKERSKSAYDCLQQKGRCLSSITPSPIVSINYMWSEKTKQWPAPPHKYVL